MRVVVRCEDLAVELAGMADIDASPSVDTRRHVQRCLRCQADLVGYRRLRRELRGLEVASLSPDEELLEEVLRQVGPVAEVHRLQRRRRRLRRFSQRIRARTVDRHRWRDRRTAGVTAGVAGAVAGGAVLASRVLVRSASTG